MKFRLKNAENIGSALIKLILIRKTKKKSLKRSKSQLKEGNGDQEKRKHCQKEIPRLIKTSEKGL